MAANCAQLRQSLAHLQSQLNVLTNKQQTAPEEPPKPDKPKKSKSKKNKDKQKNQDKTETPAQIEAAKDTTEATQPNVDEKKLENDSEIGDDKVDDKTLETLIQAINNANINLCDLEVGSDELETLSEVKDDINHIGSATDEAVNQETPTVVQNDIEIKDDKINTTIIKSEEVKIDGEVKQISENESRLVITEIPSTDDKNDLSNIGTSSNEEISHITEVQLISQD